MRPEREPDRFEKGVRFVCGSFLGIVTGLYMAVKVYSDSLLWAGLLFLAAIFACGSLAMRFGDQFWNWLGPMAGWWARLCGWIDRRS